MASLELVQSEVERLDTIEEELFSKRTSMEVLWLEIGALCSEIVKNKLYRLRLDENGNYFRTAKTYFQQLEKRFQERGLPMSYTSLNRFVGDYRLYAEELGYEEKDLLRLGKSALDEMAPTVRKKLKDAGPEAAKAFIDEILAAATANDGLPLSEVRRAVDDETGRTTKGLEVEFIDGMFGKRLKKLTLWWGTETLDLFKRELSPEQYAWVMRRMGIKVLERGAS